MRSFLLLAVLTTLCLTTSLRAQQVEDNALRFNGQSDFVAMAQTATATNSFTMEMWAKPTATHEIDVESLEGYAGIDGQRYAVFPSHGNLDWGAGHAGAGISIGTNGVSVYEHAGNYIPAVLVHETEISGWTHVAVVYRKGTPLLYINGELVRIGRPSPYRFVHPSTGDSHRGYMSSGIGGGYYGWYAGDLDNVRVWARAVDTEAMRKHLGTNVQGEGLLMSLNMNQSGAGKGLIVDNRGTRFHSTKQNERLQNASDSPLALTYGTDRTPYFVLRTTNDAARLVTVDRPREELSNPLEPNEIEKATLAKVPTTRPTLK
ncbi:MAG: LamG domain-containing protein [bacterium]|nr:LamG domain-containing protein [Candidatus Kapabacteria bacterium]